MAIKNRFKKAFKWVDSIRRGLDREESVIRNRIVPELQGVVSEFDTDIPITYERIEEGDSISYRIGPQEGVNFTRETDGASVPVSALYDWLDKGTDESHVLLIGDYKSESFPNSLNTQSQDNSQVKIYASKKYSFKGIEARNWTILVRDKYQSDIERSFIEGVKQFFRGK